MCKGENGSVRCEDQSIASQMVWNVGNLLRKLLFRLLSVGPIPCHMAFILDGNRRYARKWNLTPGAGHNAGFLAVIRMLKYCYELGVKYVTIYAFSIDNYRRKPNEVQILMNLFQLKLNEMDEVEGLVHQFGVRIYFCGDLSYLTPTLREGAEKLMKITAKNSGTVLCVCLAYTSTDEITFAVKQSCEDRRMREITVPVGNENSVRENFCWACGAGRLISLSDIEERIYMAVAPNPDILVRTSGETRLSNFLLWQTSCCLLYSPETLWPEIGLRDLVWSVFSFQRCNDYLARKLRLIGFTNNMA